MRLNQLSKHFCHSDWGISKTCILNASTASSGIEKHWFLILFFTYGNKRIHSVSSQDCMADNSSNRCFECSKMQLFEPMCESSHCCCEKCSAFGGWFSWFLLKTTGKQMVVYHSELTILRCSGGTIATCPVFPKKQAIICLEVLRARVTFVGFGSSWNTQTVDCCLLSGSYA